jgi:hypothetical protein
MPDNAQALADRLHEEGRRVVKFFNQLTPEQWKVVIYPQQSDWTMHHLLAHFVSAEIGRQELVENVYNGGEGAPQQFDIDRFNQIEVERLSKQSSQDLIRSFTQRREKLVKLVSSMSEQELNRVGRDPYLGQVGLIEMIKLTYVHLQIHLRDARRCL